MKKHERIISLIILLLIAMFWGLEDNSVISHFLGYASGYLLIEFLLGLKKKWIVFEVHIYDGKPLHALDGLLMQKVHDGLYYYDLKWHLTGRIDGLYWKYHMKKYNPSDKENDLVVFIYVNKWRYKRGENQTVDFLMDEYKKR